MLPLCGIALLSKLLELQLLCIKLALEGGVEEEVLLIGDLEGTTVFAVLGN
jgi:hypothetical protein